MQLPSLAAVNKASYLTKYNDISSKLALISPDISELSESVEFQTGSYKEAKNLAKKIFKRQKRVYKRLKKLSKYSGFSKYSALVNERSRNTLTNFKTNSKSSYKNIKRLKRSNDKLSLLEEITSLETSNQGLLEELTTLSKSAAFGDPDNSGVFGVTSLVSGNCMPGPEINTSCKLEKLSITISVRRLTHYSEGLSFIYYSFSEEPIASVESEADGSYNLELSPGEYSIFVLDGDNEYCNSFDGDGNACKLVIKETMKTEYNVTIDHSFQ